MDESTMNTVTSVASNLILMSIIVIFIGAGLLRKINVYDAFIEGAKDGFTTAVRIIPVTGKTVGDSVEFGGLLGYAPVMPVKEGSCEVFVNRGGRIPAPVQSMKN